MRDLETAGSNVLFRKFGNIGGRRAHGMIAAGMLGKIVRYADSAYHKVSAIAEFAFSQCEAVSPAPQPWR